LGSRGIDGFNVAARVFHCLIKEALEKIQKEHDSCEFEVATIVSIYF